MKMAVSWVVVSCSLVEVRQLSDSIRIYFLHCQKSNGDFKNVSCTNQLTPARYRHYLQHQRVKAGVPLNIVQGVICKYQRNL